jgi:predicted DNA-binding transcriptional regulator AlpA
VAKNSSPKAILPSELTDAEFRVLPFKQWCVVNGFSESTGRRIIKSDTGPTVTRLSARRIGITLRANREWQASREAVS